MVIARLDARSLLPPDYLVRCVQRLETDATIGAVGGVQAPVAGATGTLAAVGIGRALSNPWALGGAAYRVGRTGPADTVYLGVFRREDLLALGGWDERMLANEDYELCQRYRQQGAVVWVEGDLIVHYEARDTFLDLGRQYRAFGRSKAEYWRLTGARPAPRQLLAIAAMGIATTAGTVLALRRPRRLLGAGALTAVGLAALDHLGVQQHAPAAERGAAMLAYVTLWSSWAIGIVEGTVVSRQG